MQISFFVLIWLSNRHLKFDLIYKRGQSNAIQQNSIFFFDRSDSFVAQKRKNSKFAEKQHFTQFVAANKNNFKKSFLKSDIVFFFSIVSRHKFF